MLRSSGYILALALTACGNPPDIVEELEPVKFTYDCSTASELHRTPLGEACFWPCADSPNHIEHGQMWWYPDIEGTPWEFAVPCSRDYNEDRVEVIEVFE